MGAIFTPNKPPEKPLTKSTELVDDKISGKPAIYTFSIKEVISLIILMLGLMFTPAVLTYFVCNHVYLKSFESYKQYSSNQVYSLVIHSGVGIASKEEVFAAINKIDSVITDYNKEKDILLLSSASINKKIENLDKLIKKCNVQKEYIKNSNSILTQLELSSIITNINK